MDLTTPAGKACYEQALKGCLTELPPEESSVVKVFFSSTFTDMSKERNLLMKEAVPYLRDYCKDRGLDYQVVDMRWGVREDASLEHTTSDLCKQQIISCQQDSAGPYFVAFLGDRYGSRLLPTAISVTEYRSLRRLASWMDESDFAVVDKWYLVDTNAVPAVYRIQPITALCPHYNDTNPKNRLAKQQHQQTWKRDHEKMVKAFHVVSTEAYKRKMINSEEYEKYYISVTHTEINHGIMKSPDVNSKNIDTVLSFHRTVFDINLEDKLAKRFIDLTEDGQVDDEASELRSRLKKDVVPSNVHESCIMENTIGWTENGVCHEDPDHAAYLKKFCDNYTGKMMHMIDKCTEKKDSTSSYGQDLYKEVVAHLRFCWEKCQVFCGREKELHKIQVLLGKIKTCDEAGMSDEEMKQEGEENEDEDQLYGGVQRLLDMSKLTGATFCYGDAFDDFESDPTRDLREENIAMPKVKEFKRAVIIHGPSGSGKSSLMAKICQLSKRWVPGSVCVVRFLGTTAHSTYIRDVLVSVITQILKLYDLKPPPGLNLNVDYQYLVMYLQSLLWRIDSKTTPLFLLLDSIDQLLSTDYVHMLTWLPRMLPENVHFIISIADDHHTCLGNAQDYLPYDEQYLHLGPLDEASADKMIRATCHQAGRSLTAPQRNFLLQMYANSGQALHLKLIIEQALQWRSHYKIDKLPVADCVDGAIEMLFNDLEKTHGEVLVARALSYLTLARVGLGDGEMEDILSLDDEVLQDTYIHHLPPDPNHIRFASFLWVRLKDELKSYLSKRQAGNNHISSWFHRHFTDVVLGRYATAEVAPGLHSLLADYYLGTWSSQPKPLELYKGKAATYDDCLRGVPAQPLTFQGSSKMVYNMRKLQELPYHLAFSDRWNDFHAHVACNVEWLIAVCRCLGVNSMLHQINTMLSRDTSNMEDTDMKQLVKDIAFVKSMITLGLNEIRHDASSIPVQILGQLGPQYKGSAGIEDLVRQCQDHLNCCSQPVFMPQNAFLPAPGGLLLASVNVRLFIMGTDREQSQSLIVNEGKGVLHVVEWNANNQTDNLLVMDYDNAGDIIDREKMPFFIHSHIIIAKNRHHIFRVYTKLSKTNLEFHYVLFGANLTVPYKFERPVVAMSIASHGQLIAYTFKDDKTVHIGNPDSKVRKILVKQHMFMENPIAVLMFSPDASQLVAVDCKGNISCYNIQQRQALSLHTNTDRILSSYTPSPERYHITRSNLLLRMVSKGFSEYGLSIMDLFTRQEKHYLTSDRLKYEYSIIEMDDNEEFIIVCNSETVIVNGNKDRPALIWRLKDGALTTTIARQSPWQAAKLISKGNLYCLASCSDVGLIEILDCGPKDELFAEPILLCELKDHTKSIFTLVPINDNTRLVSAAKDNTIKFWDLERILREQIVVEEDRTLLMKPKKKKKTETEKKTVVEIMGRTTTVAVTGTADQKAFFGTDKGIVAYSQLDDSVASGAKLVTVTSSLSAVHLLLLSRKGDYLMAAGKSVVVVCDAKEGKELYKVPGIDKQNISCIAEGGYTAAIGHGGMDGKVKIWDLKTGEILKELSFLYSFHLTAVNRGGTQVVASMFEYPIVLNIFSPEKEMLNKKIETSKLDTAMMGTELTFVCISPNDRLVAACASNGSTRVVSLDNDYVHRLQQRSTPPHAVFTSDSQFLLTSGYRSMYVWRMGTGQIEYKLTRHQDFVTDLKFSVDDRFLISCSLDRSVAVWDFKARATISVLQTPFQLHSIHMLPDLSRLVYIPGQVANLAISKPNTALLNVLEHGRKWSDIAVPETLEQASTFATVFNTQKDTSKNSSAACIIL